MQLEQLTEVAETLLDQDRFVNQLVEQLKDAKECARIIREETIPNAMQELGVSEYKLTNGMKITVKQEVYAKIPDGSKQEAFTWLIDNNYGSIIKTEVKTLFGKGDRDKAIALSVKLNNQGLDAGFFEGVHHSTLKAFIKGLIEDGKPIPLDLFGARAVMIARIK